MHDSEERLIKRTTGVEYEPVFNLGNNMMEEFLQAEPGLEHDDEEVQGLDGRYRPVRRWQRILSGARIPVENRTVSHYLRKTLHKTVKERYQYWQMTSTQG